VSERFRYLSFVRPFRCTRPASVILVPVRRSDSSFFNSLRCTRAASVIWVPERSISPTFPSSSSPTPPEFSEGRDRCLLGPCWRLLGSLLSHSTWRFPVSLLVFVLCSIANGLLLSLLALPTSHNTDQQQTDKRSFHDRLTLKKSFSSKSTRGGTRTHTFLRTLDFESNDKTLASNPFLASRQAY